MANRNFKVMHTMVGQFPEGHVVSEAELKRLGYQIDRLQSIKSGFMEDGVTPRPNPALVETTEPETGEAPLGPHYGHVYGDEQENIAMAEAEEENAENAEGKLSEEEGDGTDRNGDGVIEYSEMSVAQLKQAAHEKEIPGYSTMTKAKLVAALQEAEAK